MTMDLSKFIKEYLACDDDPDRRRTLVANWKGTPGLFDKVKENRVGLTNLFGIVIKDTVFTASWNGAASMQALHLSQFVDAKNSKSWIWIREDNAMSMGTGYEL